MGMDVYTQAYWEAKDRGEYVEADCLYKRFLNTPTGSRIGSRDEDWELFRESRELRATLDLKYAHFKWTKAMCLATGFSPKYCADFTAEQAMEWYRMARRKWFSLPQAEVRNDFGEVLADGALLGGNRNPVVLALGDLIKLRKLALLGEDGYIA